ncbi:unnamed protein product, partial [Mesorhabditis spiculigera]
MGESSPNLSRIGHKNSQPLLFSPLKNTETSYSSDAMHRIIMEARPKDCYSSSEYVAYLGRKHSEGPIYGR